MDAFSGWPPGVRAAVSLSFDDAVRSQLDTAIPILNQHGLRGTFYVNPGPGSRFEREIERWRQAHAQGHELANHTVRHPCSGNFGFIGPDRALELWTLADIEADVLAASERLRALVPGIGRFSFAYPCGQTFVGRGAQLQSYVPVIARHFTVARGVGESANNPAICDLHHLSSWMVKGLTAQQLIDMVEPAIAAGHWAIFCFHGIGGDNHPIDVDAFAGLVDYLARRRPEVWTDTVQTVGEYVAAARRQAAQAI